MAFYTAASSLQRRLPFYLSDINTGNRAQRMRCRQVTPSWSRAPTRSSRANAPFGSPPRSPVTCARPSQGANSAWLSAMAGHVRQAGAESSLSWGTRGSAGLSLSLLPQRARVPLHRGPSLHAGKRACVLGEKGPVAMKP